MSTGKETAGRPSPAGIDSSAAATAQAFSAALTQVLAGELVGASDVRVSALERTTTGLSRENWTFTAAWREGDIHHSRRMILRRDPAASLLRTERKREFDVLRALQATPVPAPPVRWVDAGGTVLGAPALVMDRVAGECDWFVLNGPRPAAVRLALAQSFMAILGDVQKVDWRALGLDDGAPHGAIHELVFWAAELRRVQIEPLPEMDLTYAWLHQRAPAPQAIVLVHGDFKPGNALLLGDRISAMLDWETAHLGDPLEDLGWMTNPVRAREQQIKDLWEQAEMAAALNAATGFKIDPVELIWWNVFSCWKLAVIVLTGLQAFVAGELERIYHNPTFLFHTMFRLMKE